MEKPALHDLGGTDILFVGQTPETVDFSDPSLPPGFNAEEIREGFEVANTSMRERSWDNDLCMIAPDGSGIAMLAAQLAKQDYGSRTMIAL